MFSLHFLLLTLCFPPLVNSEVLLREPGSQEIGNDGRKVGFDTADTRPHESGTIGDQGTMPEPVVIERPKSGSAGIQDVAMNDINPGACALVVTAGDWKKTILENMYGIPGIEECCGHCENKKHCAKYSFHTRRNHCRLFTNSAIPKKRKFYLRSPGIRCDLNCEGLPNSEVCGSDSVTYDNECELGKTGCDAGSAITIGCPTPCPCPTPPDCGNDAYNDGASSCKCTHGDAPCVPANCGHEFGLCPQCASSTDCAVSAVGGIVTCEDKGAGLNLCYCGSFDNGDGPCGGVGDVGPTDASVSYEDCAECACFSAHSILTILEDGHPKSVYTKHARNGDHVLAFDDSGRLFYDEIFYRFHTTELTGSDEKTTLMKLWHMDGHIELSGHHLIYITSKTLKTTDHCITIGNETACVHRADEVSVDDMLWEIDNSAENSASFKSQKILWITQVQSRPRGVLTLNGNVVVNGIAASTHVVHHNYNHFVSSPLRFIYRFVSKDAPNNHIIDYIFDDGTQSLREGGYELMKYYEENNGNLFGYFIFAVCMFTLVRSGIHYALKG